MRRAPPCHGSCEEIETDLRKAGYRHFDFTQRDDASTAATPDLVAVAYCQGTPLRNEIESRDPGGLGRATEAATDALRARYGDGPIEGQISAVVVAAL